MFVLPKKAFEEFTRCLCGANTRDYNYNINTRSRINKTAGDNKEEEEKAGGFWIFKHKLVKSNCLQSKELNILVTEMMKRILILRSQCAPRPLCEDTLLLLQPKDQTLIM